MATDQKYFADNGDDLLWFYFIISANAADRDLAALALRQGRERALAWRKQNAQIPAEADAIDLISLVSGSYAADQLGARDRKIKDELRRAVARFGVADFLTFDPQREGVPSDVPETCFKCRTSDNVRGATVCHNCGAPLEMKSPYDVLCDALITTYTGERYGIVLGARYADVTQLLPSMRPYPVAKSGTDTFDDVAYAITHVVYTLNDYSARQLRPEWLPQEFEFLKSNLKQLIAINDSETMGEFLETLRSFGVTEDDPDMRTGVEFLLSRQNDDGSWGKLNTRSIYTRYHTTWTAMNGLMEYAWRGEGVSFPEALTRTRGA